MLTVKDYQNLALARFRANQISKDPSTKVGAVLITEDGRREYIGVNGFPYGCDDHPDLFADRPTKYARVVHAELNAVIKAGHDARGGTIYIWPLFSCSDCAKAVIQAGIARVVAPRPAEERWQSSYDVALTLYSEAGVRVDLFDREDLAEYM